MYSHTVVGDVVLVFHSKDFSMKLATEALQDVLERHQRKTMTASVYISMKNVLLEYGMDATLHLNGRGVLSIVDVRPSKHSV